jgi:AcrR family transcriptional regulator
MGYLERRQREKEKVRQKILDATLKIGKKDGWESVTIRKIANDIEYTPPIVYEHFKNKEDLINELIHHGFKILKEKFIDAKSNETQAKPLLRKLSLINWDFAEKNPALYQLMFSPQKPAYSDEFGTIISIIKSTFMILAKNNINLFQELIMNWFCLLQGAITFMPSPLSPDRINDFTPRDMFINMLERFLKSI